MRAVVLLPNLFDALGGIQTFSRTFAYALDAIAARRGWEPTLLVLHDTGRNPLAARYLATGSARYRGFSGNKPAFVAAALRAAVLADTIVLGHVNYLPLAPLLRSIAPRAKLLLSVYGVDAWRRLPPLQQAGLSQVDRILSISAYTRDRMADENGLDRDRFALFPCSLDPFYGEGAREASREDLGLPPGPLLLSVSRLDATERYKGVDRVIEALPALLRRHPDVRYVVVGDGSDRERLEGLAWSLGVQAQVRFAGRVPQELLAAHYRACDVFVLPSLKEGFGIVFLEAMWFEKPCVVARAGGAPEVVEEEQTALLVEPGNARSLEEALHRLLADPALRQRLGRAGRARHDALFSVRALESRLEGLLA